MKRIVLVVAVAALTSGCGVKAKAVPERGAKLYAPNNGNVCMMAGALPTDVKFEVLGRITATKRSYGSSDQLLPLMAYEAKKMGADAVINMQTGQRFKGPLPWRVTSPTGDGRAVKFTEGSSGFDCTRAGGRNF